MGWYSRKVKSFKLNELANLLILFFIFVNSLIGTINFYRPDLSLTTTVPPIPLSAPSGYFSSIYL